MRPASDPSATRRPTRRPRTGAPRAIRRRFRRAALQRAPLRSRGLSFPKVRHCHERAWSPLRADYLDRSKPLHVDPIALSISTPHRVAARLVVGPDDVRDVGVGNERYDAVAASGNWVGSEVDGGHSKSFSGPEVSSPGERPQAPSESPYVRIRRQPLTKPSDQPLEGEAPEFDDRRHRSSFTRPSGSSAGEHSLIASRLRANPLGREHGECGRSGGITKLSSRPLAQLSLSWKYE